MGQTGGVDQTGGVNWMGGDNWTGEVNLMGGVDLTEIKSNVIFFQVSSQKLFIQPNMGLIYEVIIINS